MSKFYEVTYGLGGSYIGGQINEIIQCSDDFTEDDAYEYTETMSRDEFDAYGLGDVDEDEEEYNEDYYEDEFASWGHYSVDTCFKATDLESLKKEILETKHHMRYCVEADELEDYINDLT